MEEFQRREPSRSCLYVADDAMFPYGEKEPGIVRDRVVSIVHAAMHQYPVDAIVVACNTASVVALEALRHAVRVPVVGTVPAVKPAVALTRTGHIAVLATNQTANDPYTDDLVQQFAKIVRVSRRGLPRLVSAAEHYQCSRDDDQIRHVIAHEVSPHLEDDVDTIVLACTHFVRFRTHFTDVLGDRLRVVDSLDGVTRRLIDVLPERSGYPRSVEPPRVLRTGSSSRAFCDYNGSVPWVVLPGVSP